MGVMCWYVYTAVMVTFDVPFALLVVADLLVFLTATMLMDNLLFVINGAAVLLFY